MFPFCRLGDWGQEGHSGSQSWEAASQDHRQPWGLCLEPRLRGPHPGAGEPHRALSL